MNEGRGNSEEPMKNAQIRVFLTWHSLTRFCNICKNGVGCAANQKISKY